MPRWLEVVLWFGGVAALLAVFVVLSARESQQLKERNVTTQGYLRDIADEMERLRLENAMLRAQRDMDRLHCLPSDPP